MVGGNRDDFLGANGEFPFYNASSSPYNHPRDLIYALLSRCTVDCQNAPGHMISPTRTGPPLSATPHRLTSPAERPPNHWEAPPRPHPPSNPHPPVHPSPFRARAQVSVSSPDDGDAQSHASVSELVRRVNWRTCVPGRCVAHLFPGAASQKITFCHRTGFSPPTAPNIDHFSFAFPPWDETVRCNCVVRGVDIDRILIDRRRPGRSTGGHCQRDVGQRRRSGRSRRSNIDSPTRPSVIRLADSSGPSRRFPWPFSPNPTTLVLITFSFLHALTQPTRTTSASQEWTRVPPGKH